MNQCGYFAKNLEAIRKINNANLTEFSEELDIPKCMLPEPKPSSCPHRPPHCRTLEHPPEHTDGRDGPRGQSGRSDNSFEIFCVV